MQGKVYSIRRGNLHDGFAHPNAVVLQLDRDSYLCVAGFTPDKEKYSKARNAESSQGIWGPAFAVEIDHTKDLDPVNPNLELHLCGYICQTAVLMTSAQIKTGREWGTLSPNAIHRIAEGLLEREKVRSYLPKKVVAGLKKLLAS